MRGQSELADIDQHVKRALRLDGCHVRNFRDAIKHVIATQIEFFPHIGDRLLIALQSGQASALDEGGRVRSAMALDRIDRLGYRFRRAKITESPSSHGVGLTETVHCDREVVGLFRKRPDADVLHIVVNELFVNLIG